MAFSSEGPKIKKVGNTGTKVSTPYVSEPKEGSTNHPIRGQSPSPQGDQRPTQPTPHVKGQGTMTSTMGTWPIKKGPRKPDAGWDG